jgi:hypothetical protein
MLNLRDNYFEGEVPTELGQLLNLGELDRKKRGSFANANVP